MLKKTFWFWDNRFVPKKIMVILVAFILLTLTGPAIAAKLSDDFSMELHPLAKLKLGNTNYRNIKNFFRNAERAIERKNIKRLMALYSDNYTNHRKDKKYAESIWKKIFATFDNLSTRHSMRLLTFEERFDEKGDKYSVAVLECSGLLKGTPKTATRPVTIDSWENQMHILILEEKRKAMRITKEWERLGNVGKFGKRFGGRGVAMHPLF